MKALLPTVADNLQNPSAFRRGPCAQCDITKKTRRRGLWRRPRRVRINYVYGKQRVIKWKRRGRAKRRPISGKSAAKAERLFKKVASRSVFGYTLLHAACVHGDAVTIHNNVHAYNIIYCNAPTDWQSLWSLSNSVRGHRTQYPWWSH